MATENTLLDNYEFLEYTGGGSFGQVHRAKHKATGHVVAVKTMKKRPVPSAHTDPDRKDSHLSECVQMREYHTLKQLAPHPNIVHMIDGFVCQSAQQLCIVMEYVNGGNLYQFMGERRACGQWLTHTEVQSFLRQILCALDHIHSAGIVHRDLKPENLLIKQTGDRPPVIKLGDFGLAREAKSSPPFTEYVSTRWYRAPEILLRSSIYSFPVDMWAVGAIFAEMVSLQPLFPGQSEIDQLFRICDILGSPGKKPFTRKNTGKAEKRNSPGFARKNTPTQQELAHPHLTHGEDGGGEWREGVRLAHKIGFSFPQQAPRSLASVIPAASDTMLHLMRQFLYYMPSRRITAADALRHPFFTDNDSPKHTMRNRQLDVMQCGVTKRSRTMTKDSFTAVNLLTTPQSPIQICPVWDSTQLEGKIATGLSSGSLKATRSALPELGLSASSFSLSNPINDTPYMSDAQMNSESQDLQRIFSATVRQVENNEQLLPWKSLRPTKSENHLTLLDTRTPTQSSAFDFRKDQHKPEIRSKTRSSASPLPNTLKQHRQERTMLCQKHDTRLDKRSRACVPSLPEQSSSELYTVSLLPMLEETNKKHMESSVQQSRVYTPQTETNINFDDDESMNTSNGWMWLKVL